MVPPLYRLDGRQEVPVPDPSLLSHPSALAVEVTALLQYALVVLQENHPVDASERLMAVLVCAGQKDHPEEGRMMVTASPLVSQT